MKACGYCGQENEESQRFCCQCGTKFIVEPEPAPKAPHGKPRMSASRHWTQVGICMLLALVTFVLGSGYSFGGPYLKLFLYLFSAVLFAVAGVILMVRWRDGR